MFINYQPDELFAFFETEPVYIGDEAAEEMLYVYEDNGFKLTVLIAVYEKSIDIGISYGEYTVLRQKFQNVSEISRNSMNDLIISTDHHAEIHLKKEKQIGVVVMNI